MVVLLAVVVGIFVLREDEPARPVAPATSDNERERQAVIDAVLGFSRVAHEANDPAPNPDHPELAVYATDRAREGVARAARENQAKGIGVRKPPNSRTQDKVEVLSFDGGTATARDCSVDDGLVVELGTGRVLNADVVTRLETVFLVKENGRWKVSATQVEQKWSGIAGCAAA
ncbi:MAG: hypothetical protein M3404_00750 [Actinomycetota bacterium]|nr:hypothetical protein [Actinomycetota bacterium]